MSELIMFVDDEENILNSLRRVFRKEPYELVTCLAAEDALKVMEQKEISVLITDQLMPGMKGTELLKVVKEKYPLVIRIVLSGHSDMDDIIQAINEGEIYRFLKKPEDLTDLVEIVNRAVEQNRLLTRVQQVFETLKNKNRPGCTYKLNTIYASGFIKVEMNGVMHLLSQERVVGILNHLLGSDEKGLDLDVIGDVLTRHNGRMTVCSDTKSGFQLLLEIPIEHKNG